MKLLKGVDYIESRLTEDLSLTRIARAAGLSNYHFSRMFRAVIGETLATYIRRRRLSEAARDLLYRDDRVIELALTYGFESQAAFSRAFKRQFGVPPAAYRKARQAMTWAYRPAITPDDFNLDKELRAMEPRIETKPAFKAIGLPGEFDQGGAAGIPDLWSAFMPRIEEVRGAATDHQLGLCFGCNGDRIIYAPAVEVRNVGQVPEGMTAWTIAEQTYAVFTVTLTGKEPIGQELVRANRYIWNVWLPQSGYAFAEAPDFEYYDRRFDPETLTGEVDIYVPVRRT